MQTSLLLVRVKLRLLMSQCSLVESRGFIVLFCDFKLIARNLRALKRVAKSKPSL